MIVAAFVAIGLATSARLQASGPGTGGGQSNTVVCALLERAYDAQSSLGLADLAAATKEYAASLGCSWAQE
jgi:hypothetical protein